MEEQQKLSDELCAIGSALLRGLKKLRMLHNDYASKYDENNAELMKIFAEVKKEIEMEEKTEWWESVIEEEKEKKLMQIEEEEAVINVQEKYPKENTDEKIEVIETIHEEEITRSTDEMNVNAEIDGKDSEKTEDTVKTSDGEGIACGTDETITIIDDDENTVKICDATTRMNKKNELQNSEKRNDAEEKSYATILKSNVENTLSNTGTIRKQLTPMHDIEMKQILQQIAIANKNPTQKDVMKKSSKEKIEVQKTHTEETVSLDDEMTTVKQRLDEVEAQSNKELENMNKLMQTKDEDNEWSKKNYYETMQQIKKLEGTKLYETLKREEFREKYKYESEDDMQQEMAFMEQKMQLLIKKKEYLSLQEEVYRMEKDTKVIESETKQISMKKDDYKTEGKFYENVRCHNCSRFGHFKTSCPYEERPRNVCFRCWSPNHSHLECNSPKYVQKLKTEVTKQQKKPYDTPKKTKESDEEW